MNREMWWIGCNCSTC